MISERILDQMMDHYLKALYSKVDPKDTHVWHSISYTAEEIKDKFPLSKELAQSIAKAQNKGEVLSTEETLDRLANMRFIAKRIDKIPPKYGITKEGVGFIKSGESFVAKYESRVAEAKAEKKRAWWNRIYDWLNKNKIITDYIAVGISIVAFILSIITFVESNNDNNELKARIEVLEKDHQQRQIESKLKLPIRK